MPMIEFSIEELQNLQDALTLLNAAKLLFRHVDEWNLPAIECKVNAVIGDKVEMNKRIEYEKGIRKTFSDSPRRLKIELQRLDRDYPLPEAYQQKH